MNVTWYFYYKFKNSKHKGSNLVINLDNAQELGHVYSLKHQTP